MSVRGAYRKWERWFVQLTVQRFPATHGAVDGQGKTQVERGPAGQKGIESEFLNVESFHRSIS